MIRIRQDTSINSRESSTSDSASRIEVAATNESTTMNETSDTFDTQTIEASEISNYAILQRELNQLNKERQQTQLFREVQKIRTIKIVKFSNETFVILTNETLIDEFQKKKLFKIINSKEYKNIIQHNLNIFIREYNEMFEIRKNIYASDKNKIFFAKSFLENVSTEN